MDMPNRTNNMEIFIETDRFILRELLETDAQGMYEMDSDPEVHKYLGNNPVQSIETIHEVIQNVRNQYRENGIGRWAVIEKNSGEFMGWSGLKYEKNLRNNLHYYDIGYRLKRKFWGQGIASETAIACLQYGFDTLDLPEICAAAHTENIASNKILTKIGLQWVETFESHGSVCNWYKLDQLAWRTAQQTATKG